MNEGNNSSDKANLNGSIQFSYHEKMFLRMMGRVMRRESYKNNCITEDCYGFNRANQRNYARKPANLLDLIEEK